MALDASDFDLVKSLRKAVRDGDEVTHRLLRTLNQHMEESNARQRELVQAFNRMADAIEGLRADLAPKLDKPAAGLKKPAAMTGKKKSAP